METCCGSKDYASIHDCRLPKGHTGNHRCRCDWNWANKEQNIQSVIKETDERWIEALGWTDLVHSAPYTQLDRKYYVKLFAESLQKEQAKAETKGWQDCLRNIRASIEGYPNEGGDIEVMNTIQKLIAASLEEEKAQRKANFVAWQAACATISRLLAEVAELKMLAEVAERQKLLSEAREGHLLKQLPRWKL